jgi:hypothetical protein
MASFSAPGEELQESFWPGRAVIPLKVIAIDAKELSAYPTNRPVLSVWLDQQRVESTRSPCHGRSVRR